MDNGRRPRHSATPNLASNRVMSAAAFNDFTVMLTTLMAALMFGLGVTLLFRAIVPPIINRMFHTGDTEKRYLEAARQGLVIRNQVRALQAESQQLDSQRIRLTSELQTLKRQSSAAASRPPDFIHEVGEPLAGQSKYVARVMVGTGSSLLRTSSELYNPIWRHLNLVDVWASTPEEARNRLDLAYPDKLGYQKHFLDGPPPRTGTPSR